MVPVIIGGVVGAKVISDMWQADKYDKQARNANYEAFSSVETAARRLRSQHEKLEATLLKLANRKKGIMSDYSRCSECDELFHNDLIVGDLCPNCRRAEEVPA